MKARAAWGLIICRSAQMSRDAIRG